jgi:hypothetical protein
MQKYISEFMKVLGEPNSSENLELYVNFVLSNAVLIEEPETYYENHHLLPRCIFESDEIFKLTYVNHVKAHVLLANAYPIPQFIRPLNFMLSREEKEDKEYRKLLSISIKENWKTFKKTGQYLEWKKKRSISCRKHVLNGHAKNMSDKGNTEENRKLKSELMKMYWSEEKRKEKSISMIEYNKIHGTERYSAALFERYSSMNLEEYQEFVNKMTEVNRNQEKRKKAGQKIKDKWKDPVYFEKMKKRKRADKETKSNAMKELWADPIWKQQMIDKRKRKKEENKHEAN